MSVLSVDPAELDDVANEADSAQSHASKIKVGPVLEGVTKAMPGGNSGNAAKTAAQTIDNDISSLTLAIENFAQAVRDSAGAYNRQDTSGEADFSSVTKALEGTH